MCIDESKEFEAINQKASERKAAESAASCSTEKIRLARKAEAKGKAVVFLGVTLAALIIAMIGITALEQIGWINDTFRIVLQCVAGCLAMFKAGYLWHEIKN